MRPLNLFEVFTLTTEGMTPATIAAAVLNEARLQRLESRRAVGQRVFSGVERR